MSETELPNIPDDWIFVDLEIGEEPGCVVFKAGALRGERELTVDAKRSDDVAALESMSEGATLVVGHNWWAFDRHHVAKLRGAPGIARLPAIDTLVLSPFCFPREPFHKLVKEHKLVDAELNDPVQDCRLARRLLIREIEAIRSGHWATRFAVSALSHSSSVDTEGVRRFFEAIGIAPAGLPDALRDVASHLNGLVCRHACGALFSRLRSGEADPLDAAYAIAWISVAGSESALPRWVRHQFPSARDIVDELRETSCGDPVCRWCTATNDPTAALKKLFGFAEFRPIPAAPDGGSLQEQIVRHGMARESLFAVLPTGGGKSLCFQVPALVRNERTGRLTVVVSPLQSLMKDQVDTLDRSNPDKAGQINGMLTLPERARELERVRTGETALLYVSPEQLRNKSVRAALEAREIACWVFDEAHCLSAWGHDFRTDYLYAPRFVRELAQRQGVDVPPISCFTATAQKRVIDEVTQLFANATGHSLRVLDGGVERTNLAFEILAAGPQNKRALAAELLREHLPEGSGAGVVFAPTRNECKEVAEYLSEFEAKAYHAGLDSDERRKIQDEFKSTRDKRAVIVATSAFGMGVDKDNVRVVIHLEAPGSVESYLQQAGRAGRDGKPAKCFLLFDEGDAETQFGLSRRARLRHADLQAIHRAIRRAPAQNADDGWKRTVVTRAELMRIGSARAHFNPDDPMEHTRVSTAVSWLERAELVTRDENVNRVFTGSLRAKTLAEALGKLEKLNLSVAERGRWERVLRAFAEADPDDMLSAELVAAEAGLIGTSEESVLGAGDRVLNMLRQMATAGLLGTHMRFTAFVRKGVADSAADRFARLREVDRLLLDEMRLAAPDMTTGDTSEVDLGLIAELIDRRLGEPVPADTLRWLLRSYAHDGRGFALGGKSLTVRNASRQRYGVTLQREWGDVVEARTRFFDAANVVRSAIERTLGDQRAVDLCAAFTSEELEAALTNDIALAGHIKAVAELVEPLLLLLHDTDVITLQNGLAVFRQAMTIRHRARDSRRQFRKIDYEPLQTHYERRTTQTHVMAEFGRVGVRDTSKALRLAKDWFELSEAEFLVKWMPGRREELSRATTAESYARIVTTLKNDAQEAIVGSSPESNRLVLAGPGAGKTRVVVHRIAWLVRVAAIDPAGIFALAYNRSAASTIRARLGELIGADARWVRVHTVHGLAARIVQRPFDTDDGEAAFDALLERATSILKGTADGVWCQERERLVAGCTHLMIDEYQDITSPQAEFISALSGRLDPDGRKLSVMAVGDDDQNIYAWNGASVEFIRAFAESYTAERSYLVENFRSTANIVEAANGLISFSGDVRLKSEHPIRVNTARVDAPRGGRWESLDELARGRVRLVVCEDELSVGDFVSAEFERLRGLDHKCNADDFAVLAPRRRLLYPVREGFRAIDQSCRWQLDRAKSIPAGAVREISEVIRWLQARGSGVVSVDEVIAAHGYLQHGAHHPDDPWCGFVARELAAWEAEWGRTPASAGRIASALREAVAEERRTHAVGSGVMVSTLHGAKGLEWPHVFVVPGELHRDDRTNPEAYRRLLYVGLTRAKETLTIVTTANTENPFVRELAALDAVDKTHWTTINRPAVVEYDMLGLSDFWIDWAGQQRSAAVREALRGTRYGSYVKLARAGANRIDIRRNDTTIAKVKAATAEQWASRLDNVESARVVAMVRRTREDSGEGFQEKLDVDAWEVPIIEVRRRV